MASQLVSNASTDLQVFEVHSYVRGYHAYKDNWTPAVDELLLVRREPSNLKDRPAVAVPLLSATFHIIWHHNSVIY